MSAFARLQKLNGEVPSVYEKKVVSAVTDFVEDVVDTVVEIQVDFIDNVLIPDVVVDEVLNFAETAVDVFTFGLVDEFTDDIFEFARNINAGIEFLTDRALTGDLNAMGQLAVLIGTTALTVASFGSTAPAASVVLASYGTGITSSVALMGVYYTTYVTGLAMSIYSLYGVAISLAEIGAIVSAGGITSLFLQLNAMSDAMKLSLVGAWINGSMNLWMAGGVLYDAPKAGDVLFNPTGDLNTTKFLNIPNKNTNTWMKWSSGKYHEYQKQVFGNMAGSEFFAVSPIAQRI